MERNAEYDRLRQAFGYFGDLDKPKPSGKAWKCHIELNKDLNSLYSKLGYEKGITTGDVIARALASYVYLQEELKAAPLGSKLSFTNQRDEVLRDINLP